MTTKLVPQLWTARTLNRFTRRLCVEFLEERTCLAFTHSIVAGVHTFTGGNTIWGLPSNDTLKAIYANGTPPTIWYETDPSTWDADGIVDTGVAIPSAAAPISIRINGLGGNDVVDVWAGAIGTANFGLGTPFTLPLNSVSRLTFDGGEGNDTFTPPHSVPGVGSVVIVPLAGSDPNIVFLGGTGIDTLNNMNDPELFDGDSGADIVSVAPGNGGGDDILNGGPGADTMSGGPGDDTIDGNVGGDILNGDAGDDTISGGADGDNISGGPDNDTISGGTATDSLHGDGGNDTINGNEDNDEMWGGTGDDIIQTGTSFATAGIEEDYAPGGPWFEVAFGEDGMDIIDAISATGATYLDGGGDGDLIYGSAYDDSIYGRSGWDTVLAWGGNDTVHGDDGNDELYGEGGNDKIWGGVGDDLIETGTSGAAATVTDPNAPGGPWLEIVFGEDGLDEIDAMEATGSTYLDGGDVLDIILGSESADTILGGAGNDTLHGFGGADTIRGGSGEDTIDGGEAGDSLFGEADKDTIYGGAGPDTLSGGTEDDTLWSNTGEGDKDQPYLGTGGTPGWPDMRHTGNEHCDLEDGHPDLDPGCSCSGWATPQNDEYHTLVNQTLVVTAPGVLANDSASGTLTAVIHSGPAYGSLTLNADGSFTYVPQTSTPYDSFSYSIPIGCYSNMATVTIIFDNYGHSGLMLDQPEKVAAAAGGEVPDCGCGHKPPAAANLPPGLELGQLTGLSDAAIQRWRAAGADRRTLEAGLANLAFVIADLPGRELATAGSGTIFLDIDAAGHGWFIDATPGNDREFQRHLGRSQRQAVGNSPAADHVDLLTVVMHEIGHLLGLDHSETGRGNLMQGTLGLGTRRLPTAIDAGIADWLFAASQDEQRR